MSFISGIRTGHDMNFERHWKQIDNSKHLSLGNGLIKADLFFTSMIPKGDPKVYQTNINGSSIGRFKTEDEAKKAIEDNITLRVIKLLNQVGYGVK